MKTQIKNFLFGSAHTNSSIFDWSYLLFRVYAGFSIAKGAGFFKMIHKIDEKGPLSLDNLAWGTGDWFVQQVSDLGFTFISPSFWAYLAIYGEFIGGLLIALGIFTRLSSIQLAFQFFVVSFIWYNEPAPMFGMYYQQLIFWSFVMTFGAGDGRYSLATWLKNRRFSLPSISKPAIATATAIMLINTTTQAQDTAPVRVNFEVKNPTLKGMEIEFRSYYDTKSHKLMGAYGYSLNALASHAVNMVAPVRIYNIKDGKRELILVVNKQDEGKAFMLNKTYEISREDYLQVANDEMNEKTDRLAKVNKDKGIEEIAQEKGINMVTFIVKGSSIFPSQVYVRYQLPWDNNPKSPTGFSRPMSSSKSMKISLPVGTKVYLCSGEYWNASSKYTEKLIVTVDEEKANYTFKL
jgi:uncharacterized membrane protein YphA (DoxX/SURF4 family)